MSDELLSLSDLNDIEEFFGEWVPARIPRLCRTMRLHREKLLKVRELVNGIHMRDVWPEAVDAINDIRAEVAGVE